MKTRENMINESFKAIREGAISRNLVRFGEVGADAADAVAKAYEFTANVLLAKKGEVTRSDFTKLFHWKLNRLHWDAERSANCAHGRLSVKAATILDEDAGEEDEYSVPLADKVAMARYVTATREPDAPDRSEMQSLAIRQVLREHGRSERDCDIIDRLIFCAPDREQLAKEFKVTTGNIARIKCLGLPLVERLGPEIRRRYEKLVRTQGPRAA